MPAAAVATAARPQSIVPSWVVYGFQFVAIGAWTAYAVVYFEAMGIDIAVIGVLAAVPAVVAILASPAWGLVADRLGDMRVPYLVAAVWAALAAVGLAMAPGMPVARGGGPDALRGRGGADAAHRRPDDPAPLAAA